MNELTPLEGPALIIAALIGIGRALKASALPDKWIPSALALLGAISLGWLKGWTAENFLIGITLGGTAVWGNQQWRQLFGGGDPPKPPVALLLAGLLAVGTFCGCRATLETGGAYAPAGQQADMAFYAVDGAFDLAFSTVDAAFKFEKQNRAQLWKISPNIKHTLDKIRPEASQVVRQYLTAREAYKKNPTVEGLSDLETALATIKRLADAAIAVIPKGN